MSASIDTGFGAGAGFVVVAPGREDAGTGVVVAGEDCDRAELADEMPTVEGGVGVVVPSAPVQAVIASPAKHRRAGQSETS